MTSNDLKKKERKKNNVYSARIENFEKHQKMKNKNNKNKKKDKKKKRKKKKYFLIELIDRWR